MRVFNNVSELVGHTPLVKLNKLSKGLKSNVYVKMESFNPSNSVKDRAALNMIVQAEKRGLINQDTTIIEATSGNTGIALATLAAARGYKLILFIPDTMSIDKIHHVEALGAIVKLTPGVFGMNKAFMEAEELYSQTENAYMPHQITNMDNPNAHKETTAIEIWEDMDGAVDCFVAASGTGGTVCGTGEKLKEYNPNIKVICVEPAGSAVLSGEKRGPHKIQGVGPGFIPEITNVEIFDEIIKVTDDQALDTARRLAREEGMFVGISSGASVYAALEVAKRVEKKNIVVISADTGERYLNTELFNSEFNDIFVS